MKKALMLVLAVGLCAVMFAPSYASEKAVSDNSASIKAALAKIEKLETQTVCPLSGNAVNETSGYVFMGYNIRTCCDDCAAGVKKDPLSAIKALRAKGQNPALAEGYHVQKNCPMSGKAVVEGMYGIKDNMLVTLCCAGCKKAVAEDIKTVKTKLNESKAAPVILTLDQTLCPISGHAISKEVSATAKGKKVYMCCAACVDAFNEKPDEFLQAMADEGVVPDNAS
ncbi:MAG: hypothetical protein P9L94_18800 [Candidatus Hinthialibacter antarcticus]|nr:hypothetical protein [Candidatus Hinthialibacter antarcticus]